MHAELRTAFRSFSTACCAWKPMTSSGEAGSGSSFWTVYSSSAAFRRRIWACSRDCIKDLAFLRGLVEHGAWRVGPVFECFSLCHQHLYRYAQRAQGIAQAHHLAPAVVQIRFHHQEI